MEKLELVVTEENQFQNWAKQIEVTFLELSDCQDTDARNIGRQFIHRKLLYN